MQNIAVLCYSFLLFANVAQLETLIIKLKIMDTKGTVEKQNEPHKILLIMGGSVSEARGNFEYYDLKTNRRSKLYSQSPNNGECTLVEVNKKIYIVSWEDIAEYDLENNRSFNSVKMNIAKRNVPVGVLNDSIYAVGGAVKRKAIGSVEKFDVNTQKWSFIPSLLTERIEAGVGVLNGLLYAVGGHKNECLKSVEYYDPNLNVWKPSSDLITPRHGAGVGILHNKMYVVGGIDVNNECLKSVECLSLETNQFTQMASLNIPRKRPTMVEFENKLYAIGGYNEGYDLNTIEVYHPEIDKWELLPTRMNVPRRHSGVVFVEKMVELE